MSSIEETECMGHIRYNHLNFRILSELSSKNLVYGLAKFNTNTMACETCLRGKQSRMTFASGMSKI